MAWGNQACALVDPVGRVSSRVEAHLVGYAEQENIVGDAAAVGLVIYGAYLVQLLVVELACLLLHSFA